MQKFEVNAIRSAIANNHAVTDLVTVRQAETIGTLADHGILEIDRKEKVKTNLVIVEYRLASSSVAQSVSELAESETETEGEG